MKFSCHVHTRISDAAIARDLEGWGYDAVWFTDTQMMWSDCFATMALAAQCTSKIRIGTGVSVAGTRIAPTTAAAIASINVLAPGRTFLGIGTGHTAMRVMGQDPMPVREFREYLRVVRGLLRGEPVEYTYRGATTEIVWQTHGGGFRNTWDEIPIYVAANGPLALKAAGAYGDGLISMFNERPEGVLSNLDSVRVGAQQVGRALTENFHTVLICHPVILRSGENLGSLRVQETAGPWVLAALHFIYEVWRKTRDDGVIPVYARNVWDAYLERITQIPLPEAKLHQVIHDGHAAYSPTAERHLVTRELIDGICIVGSPTEVADKIRAAGNAGLKEVSLMPPLMQFRSMSREFAEQVIPLI